MKSRLNIPSIDDQMNPSFIFGAQYINTPYRTNKNNKLTACF